MASLSNITGVGVVATINGPGTITLPLVSETPNRQLIFKDGYGNLSNYPLTFQTQGLDLFEDGTTTIEINNSFGFITLYGYEGTWYTLGGTNQLQGTISSLTVSSINGLIPMFEPAFPSSISTLYGTSFTTSNLTASSITAVNVARSPTNLWVAVGLDSTANNTIKYTGNGINWSNSASGGFTNQGYGVAWSGSLWVAVGSNNPFVQNNTIKYSGDGINWSNSSGTGFSLRGRGVAWNGQLWVAVGEDGTPNNRLKYSNDGINWLNSAGTGFTSGGYSVAWNGSLWVAVGIDSTPNNTIKYSIDGITWSNAASGGFSTGGYGVAWNGRIWVAVGSDTVTNNTVKYSTDGSNWSNSTGVGFEFGYGQAVAWNGYMWVAVGYNPGANKTILYSYDGISWTVGNSVFTAFGQGIAWNGNLWVAVGSDGTQNNRLKYSSDGINWSNSAGTGFTTYGNGIAFSYDIIPSYKQQNLQILPQGIPLFLTSTNQILAIPSSLVLNNTLTINNFTDRVGINTGNPQTDLDVNGTGRFITVSSLQVNVSSVLATAVTTSSLQVNSITVGTGTGWVNLGPLQTVAISSIQANVNDAYMNNLFVGTQSTVNEIMFNGLFGNYNNTVLAEVSTGAGTQELLVFKGSSTSDRIRFQTTGNFVIETGVSARLFNSNTTTTQPNAIGAMFINTTSNVGIQCNAPTAALDVNGTGRFITVSSIQAQVSSVTGQAATISSIAVNSLVIGSGTGWVNFGPIQTVAISSIQANTNILYGNIVSSFQTQASSIMIATSNSAYTFDVNGSGRISSLILAHGTTAFSTLGPAASNIRLGLTTGDAYKPTGASWSITSDMRIKEGIVDANFEMCYDTVKQIRLRRFHYASSFVDEAQVVDKRVLGFIAQEISTIVPKAITVGQGFGYDDLQMINIDQIQMSYFGAMKKLIFDKEALESTTKGQRFELETLQGKMSSVFSTLEGLQGR